MSKQLFLAPASKGSESPYNHLQKTVVEGVGRAFYRDYLDEDLGDLVRIWGVRSGSKPSWDYIRTGDWLFFYVGQDLYEYAAPVIDKREASELARDLWADYVGQTLGSDVTDNAPYDYLIFLGEVTKLSLPSPELHQRFGYNGTTQYQFSRVSPKALNRLKAQYDSIEEVVEEYSVNDDER